MTVNYMFISNYGVQSTPAALTVYLYATWKGISRWYILFNK